ncbi:MAG: electron transfer flavoprotein subunit beta/FixA family protein [Bacteroidota bacterium]
MNILVCVSKTPETTAKIKFTDDNTSFDSAGVQYILNPYDEWYALVRALELKEAQGGSVTVLNVGPATNDPVIRKALAIGADKAVRIDADPQSSLYVAKQIAEFAKDKEFDLVFFGKETIDYNGSEVGAMVAEYLGHPFLSYVSHMDMNGNTATATRDIEGGVEVVELDTPFVLSAAKGLAEQRIPNMMGIMQSKRKPLTVEPAVGFDDPTEIVSYAKPPEKSDVVLVDADNMDELVRLLHEEAKVI